METYFYVGTYTAGLEGGAGGFRDGPPGEGVYAFRLDCASGAMEPLQTVPGLRSPSFLAKHPQLPVVYAAERIWSDEDRTSGALTTFAIQADGRLEQVSRVKSGGRWPAHLSVDPSGRWVLLANPLSRSVACFPIGGDGLPGELASTAVHEGHGPNERQKAPYPHSVWTDVSGRWALACDLGIDRIMIYRLDETSGELRPADLPFAQVSSGAGARHLAVHPSNRFVYLVNELDSTLSVFTFDGDSGRMEIVQTVVSPPEDFSGYNHGSHAIVHPSGRYLYSANRGHDSLTIFAIDETTGRLKRIREQPTLGITPRNFNIAPCGDLLLAANQHTPNIVSFRMPDGGADLVPTGHSITTPSPVCIVFAQV